MRAHLTEIAAALRTADSPDAVDRLADRLDALAAEPVIVPRDLGFDALACHIHYGRRYGGL